MKMTFKTFALATALVVAVAAFSGCTGPLTEDPSNGGSTPTEEMITISLYTGTADPNDIEPTRIRSNLVDEDIYDRDYVFAHAVDITSNQLTAEKTYYVEGTAGKDYLIITGSKKNFNIVSNGVKIVDATANTGVNINITVPTTEYSGVALPADPFLLVPAVVANGTVTGTKGVKVMKGDGSYYTIQ